MNGMNNSQLICKPLTELADIERVQKNKIYPAGTIYVQVSACRKGTEKIWNIMRSTGMLEDKYAVVIPRVSVIPRYFSIALENVTDEWMHRYVGSSINISMELFKYLKVAYHPDYKDQCRVLAVLDPIQDAIDDIEARIELEQEAKNWFLEKMIASCTGATIQK